MKKSSNSQSLSTPSLTEKPRGGASGGYVIIFCAPSGSGKSTIINSLMPRKELNLFFSVSATTRPPRGEERNGVEYLFMSSEEFRKHIVSNDFIEYEEVYTDRMYGTLKSQVDSQLSEGQNVVFDVDVHGGMRLKEFFGSRALSIFIQPPSIATLRQRLEDRGTDAPEVIQQRLDRAEYELSFAQYFDHIVINDDLETAKAQAYQLIQNFLDS